MGTVKRTLNRLFPCLFLSACFLNHLGGPEDKVVSGRIARVDEDPRYEAYCGILSRFIGQCSDSPKAYHAMLIDTSGAKTYFWFFVPQGDYAPIGEGLEAKFHLHRGPIYELQKCQQQRGMTSQGCPYDVDWRINGWEDVAPRASGT